MRKLKIIIILIIGLQIAIPVVVENCFRFPILVLHFIHHSHHKKIDFTNFVTEHYSGKHHQENHDGHENLPFHKHCDDNISQTLAFTLETSQLNNCLVFIFKVPNKISFKQDYLQSNVSLNIWKPPKICYQDSLAL